MGNVSPEPFCTMPLPLVEKTGVSLLLCVSRPVLGSSSQTPGKFPEVDVLPTDPGRRKLLLTSHLYGRFSGLENAWLFVLL